MTSWNRADLPRRWSRHSNVVSLDDKRRQKRQKAEAVAQLHPRGRFVNVSVPEPVADGRSIWPCHPGGDAA